MVVAEDHEQYEKVKEERIRARSAVIGGVQKNEFQRRKMNEIRLIQAKTKDCFYSSAVFPFMSSE